MQIHHPSRTLPSRRKIVHGVAPGGESYHWSTLQAGTAFCREFPLVNGYYQGWDLHPAQLPTRYAAVFAFFLSARPAATLRLRSFIDKAAQATLVGDVFDDAATGQGLLNFFIRGVSSGALTLEEASEAGLTYDELMGRSFVRIVEARRNR